MKKSDVLFIIMIITGILSIFMYLILSNLFDPLTDGRTTLIFSHVHRIIVSILSLVFPIILLFFIQIDERLKQLLYAVMAIALIYIIFTIIRLYTSLTSESLPMFSIELFWFIVFNILWFFTAIYGLIQLIYYIQIEKDIIVRVTLIILVFFMFYNMPFFNYLRLQLLQSFDNTLLILQRYSTVSFITSVIRFFLIALTVYILALREERNVINDK
ncbi:MAG: hypothetical protein K9L26_02750 [Candidatus Izimaplasma sp.]|nr:hypothetical protein [Candidatus Izimaplasma bacterium]